MDGAPTVLSVHDDLASFLCIVCFNWGQLIIGLPEEIEAARPLVRLVNGQCGSIGSCS
jgi:hypothetical protein